MKRKADEYRKPLLHTRVDPVSFVNIKNDEAAYQNCKVIKIQDVSFPIVLGHEEIIVDFGNHYTGYLNIEMCGDKNSCIPDSPTVINFEFAEMPIELVKEFVYSKESLSVGWLQSESKSVAFMPYKGSLERRYSFRYLKLKRTDTANFKICLTALYIDAVSAVNAETVKPLRSGDDLLDRIDAMCVNTLKECEQDVFEDGPKRDRRLWIGDLRLQALVDYQTFNNISLIKRCIYLFAENLTEEGLVTPCVFPDTPPYIDQWIYLDYSLCLVLCLSDYLENTGDSQLPLELYDIALNQIKYAERNFDRKNGKINAPFFIDHGNYNRDVAALGYLSYVLVHTISLSEKVGKPTEWLKGIYKEVTDSLLRYRDIKTELFITDDGEISWQSQVWTALSGALSKEECRQLLKKTRESDPQIRMSSPFMTHYYLEALYKCDEQEYALKYIKNYWGAMLTAGYDCCPECFDTRNDMLSPYANIVLNSACHAWSCTPTYLIRKYHAEEKAK